MDTIEIKISEYDALKARPSQEKLDEVIARAEKAEKDLEAAETAKVKVEGEKAELQTKVDAAEETARQTTLRDERIDSLGAGFIAALGEKTKERLRTQAAQLDDTEWTARLEELEELTGKKRDLGASDKDKANGGEGGTFTADEVARFQGGAGGGSSTDSPTPNQRRSVFAGLSK